MGLLEKILVATGTFIGLSLTKKAIDDHKERKKQEEERKKQEKQEEEIRRQEEQEELIKRERAKEREEIRKNTPLVFKEPITEELFQKIVIDAAKPIKRLKVVVRDQFVAGSVTTISGIKTWDFAIDFNDFGNLTGKYWLVYCENDDSEIPLQFAKKIKAEIKNINANYSNN